MNENSVLNVWKVPMAGFSLKSSRTKVTSHIFGTIDLSHSRKCLKITVCNSAQPLIGWNSVSYRTWTFWLKAKARYVAWPHSVSQKKANRSRLNIARYNACPSGPSSANFGEIIIIVAYTISIGNDLTGVWNIF